MVNVAAQPKLMNAAYAVVITALVLTVLVYLMVIAGKVTVAVYLQITQVMIVMTVPVYPMVALL